MPITAHLAQTLRALAAGRSANDLLFELIDKLELRFYEVAALVGGVDPDASPYSFRHSNITLEGLVGERGARRQTFTGSIAGPAPCHGTSLAPIYAVQGLGGLAIPGRIRQAALFISRNRDQPVNPQQSRSTYLTVPAMPPQ